MLNLTLFGILDGTTISKTNGRNFFVEISKGCETRLPSYPYGSIIDVSSVALTQDLLL